MFIKQLELVGFKSFAEKTTVKFSDGMTCIVGPNGCGKSNIGEAIRWVFGEQSAKKLRGSSMDDFIFNGTNQRKPLNRAEVTITLNNENNILPSEYNDVTVKRRVFSDGQSEYFINNQKCRLKDVRNLITDTGIGVSAYSFIEQGMISEILSSDPTERRRIFEEAAGVMKYRVRKKETMKKLNDTEENVDRLKDIIHEVERQRQSLEKQVEKAKKYKKLRKKLESKEVVHFKVKNDKLESKIDRKKKLINKIEDDISNYNTKISTLKADMEDKQIKLIDKEDNLKKIENSIYNKKLKMEKKKSKLDNLINHRKLLKEEIKNLDEEISELKTENENIDDEISRLNKSIKKISFKKDGKEDEINKKQQKLDNKKIQLREAEEKYERKVSILLDHMKDRSKIKTEINNKTSNINNYKKRNENLESKNEKLDENLTKQKHNLKNINENIENKKVQLKKLEEKLEENKQKLTKEKEKLTNKIEKKDEKKDKLKNIEAKLNSIEMLEKKMEGLNRGTKNILKNKNRFDLEGILADYIEVDEGYERIFENLLAENIQVIIPNSTKYEDIKSFIDNREDGEKFIYFNNELTQNNGEIHKDSILKYCIIKNEKLKPLLQNLLGSVLYKEKFEKKYLENGYSMVLKDGSIYHPNGLVIYADLKNQGMSIIERKSLKEKYQDKIDKLKDKLENVYSEIDNKKQVVNKLEDENSKISDKINENNKKLSDLKKDGEYLEKEINRLKEEYSINKKEIKINRNEIKELKKEKKEKKDELSDLKKKQDGNEQKKKRLQNEINSLKSEIDTVNDELSDLKDKYSEIKNQHNSKKKDLNHLKNRKNKNLEMIENKNNKIEENKNKITSSKEQEDQLKKDIDNLVTEIDNLEERKVKANEKVREIKDEVSKMNQKIEDIRKKLEKKQNKLRENEVDYTKLTDELNNLSQYIYSKYDINENYVKNLNIPEEYDFEEYKREIDKIKSKIKSLGNINLSAIDEYEELNERYDFLISQKSDLDESKEKLEQALDKIENISEEKFIDTFYKIKNNFKEIFPELFNGGKADISLIVNEDEDVLNSGIDVNVKPPGKRLQNINLLSGGEKALSAIALLFSIFKVKPAPFCVLDEIDAPLDDTNVSRFINLLSDFTDTTQFIIITHNKYTIESADSLYGVTMEEPGVSSLVSVSIQEYE